MLSTGVTQRMNSSVATVMSAPSRSSWYWSGRLASSMIVRAITVRVVSAPAVEQQQAVVDDPVEADRLAVDLGRGPDGHDVVGRAALLLLVELGARTGELHRRGHHVVVDVARTTAADDGALPTTP